MVNPKDGQVNCQTCAVAVDKLPRGEPMSAVPHDRPMDSPIVDAYTGGNWHSGSFSGLVARMKILPEGSHGIVLGFSCIASHAFNARKGNGIIQFLDGRQGIAGPEGYDYYFFARMDNPMISEDDALQIAVDRLRGMEGEMGVALAVMKGGSRRIGEALIVPWNSAEFLERGTVRAMIVPSRPLAVDLVDGTCRELSCEEARELPK
ncbi:toxin glutamine deamidase domain-containing protein [Actinomadura gamaensis]|uniref:Toxin glutamine deamidase domain-containing protein n=1 Tax=Actinomadura gamaensis TaxID=1763541 RepID=A0ABV9UEU2_9ACTN